MKSFILSSFIVLIVFGITGFAPVFISGERPSIEGTWVRKADHLKIRIMSDTKADQMYSLIVEEGDEKFPCEVSALPIYKNIIEVEPNRWKCDFLVVTMGTCSTNYESGEIIITKTGDLVVICPGFTSKVYEKLRPRYEVSSIIK